MIIHIYLEHNFPQKYHFMCISWVESFFPSRSSPLLCLLIQVNMHNFLYFQNYQFQDFQRGIQCVYVCIGGGAGGGGMESQNHVFFS